ncbi:MAG: MFS transporter [Rhodospirillaceae bacterium]|nr:MFS transporter [Rhodospirillaceae bacterium]
MRKVTMRLVPFMALLYFANYLDRVNVGFAALTMNQDLQFSATVYGTGAGILFLGYVLFQVPSNMALQRIGTRLWITCIMVVWGLMSAAMAFVADSTSFYILRFLLGVAEAGFFPGMILYLTTWFPVGMRAKITAIFMMAIPMSSVLGAPVSTALLNVRGMGLDGWQWLFILQGIPASLFGLMVLRVLTDEPAKATWLADDERGWLVNTLKAEHAQRDAKLTTSLKDVLLNYKFYLFGLMYFGMTICLYGLSLWLPQIVKSLGDLTNMQVGLLTAVPYIVATGAMYFWGGHSDRTGERKWHVALPITAGGVFLGISGCLIDAPAVAFLALAASAVTVYVALPQFWTLPTAVLGSATAAAGIALVNAVGNIGGYVGPVIVGVLKDMTGSYAPGLTAMGGFAILSGILALAMGHDGRTEPGRIAVDGH